MKNLLIKSDNLKGLNYLLADKQLKGKIDLVYIDPPFATGGISQLQMEEPQLLVIQKMEK